MSAPDPVRSDSDVVLVPFGQDPLAVAAEQILEHYRDQLPDLSRCQVLVADERCAAQFRAQLLNGAERRGFPALLGPGIERLDQWLNRVSAVTQTVLNRPAQELVLAEALRGASGIYADTDPWLLADQLLHLFDEMTRSDMTVADEFDEFLQHLSDSYGIRQPSPSLQQEAFILHTLWHAWRRQLQDSDLLDPASAYRQQLTDSMERVGGQTLWLLGYTEFSAAEAHWLRTLLDRQQARLILHGSAGATGCHPEAPLTEMLQQLEIQTPADNAQLDPFNAFIDSLFTESPDNLKHRAAHFAHRHPQDPVLGRLTTLQADDPEQQAQAVALQVRRWLLDDVQPVAIVTGDRRLARRVRALLEASEVTLDDTGGWALSTTSAAAALERWLETVEEDFACGPLLDVLKSPFVSIADRDTHLAQVRRLEQDIILHENIARGLERYRHHLDVRSERLPDWSEPMRLSLHHLLNRLDHAASPLLPLQQGSYPVEQFLHALHSSLQELGVHACFETDAAGQQLLEVLGDLQQAARHSSVTLRWTEFRNWLGRNLERATFRPPLSASPVQLLTLEQSRLQRFAATIVAGCSRNHLPGTPASHAFFNQRVRAELGLTTWSQTVTRKLHHFCRVLHNAPRVLLTSHREQDGEAVLPSPWLELLDVFYRNAYGNDLAARELKQLVTHPQARPATPDSAPLPGKGARPAPPAAVLPKTWSASTHQRLIDCPYRFFAADALSLKPQDEIREALSKADYGALVHRIVQAFNSKVRGLPGPWSDALTPDHYDQALALLNRISGAVFANAIEDNFQARSWYRQWQKVISGYLDWEIQRRSEWQQRRSEFKAERHITGHLRIIGRIDRIDQRGADTALVDYKTGRPPSSEDVLSGEAVQLSSYALSLDEPVSQLDYIEFGKDKVTPKTCAQGDALKTLLTEVEERIRLLDTALQDQAALPAWGDPTTCSYCEFTGVCRREMWLHGEPDDG